VKILFICHAELVEAQIKRLQRKARPLRKAQGWPRGNAQKKRKPAHIFSETGFPNKPNKPINLYFFTATVAFL
jgi:hypothetical protein